jgi:DNA-binding NarL/FixJ family response regulator
VFPDVSGSSLLFMIVDDAPIRAQNLKELIEFMDVPQVQVVAPEDWRSGIGDRRLAAVFLSNDLEEDRLRRLISDVGEHDPNVPIVFVNHSESHA